ncbi:histidine kinase [Pseudoflavonifractor sp. 60]|uniref:sensor histidine kinase n=1 Tax=Pseudoflavonifractor sp. 60 TaxID=2304576 RepID=UPI001FAD07C3|nr:histidine kinase [Pseudoflavonifractor sp. 60]
MLNKGTGKFKQKLLKSVSRKMVLLLLISALIFTMGQYAVILIGNETNARSHLRELEASYQQLDHIDAAFLQDEATIQAAQAVLSGEQGAARLQQLVRRLNLQSPVSSEFILSDLHGNVLAASFPGSTLSSYLWNYNAAICYHARSCEEDEIYRSVYYDNSTYSDRMFVKPVYRDSTLLGFLTLYLSGAGWNYDLSETNFDGVITDLRGNIMYSSKQAFASVDNKFSCNRHGSVELNGLRYWILGETTADGRAIIYSLVYYPRNDALTTGLIALALAAAAWYITARNVFSVMADSNAASVEYLVQELRYIRTTDSGHRIVMDSDDEFSEVAHQTNYMLDALKELNERNTELLRRNNRIEIEQLTAQMNPHFLYNTLEVIRALALFDGVKAEQVITELTQVLRYSVDFSRDEVPLRDDIFYIQNYLNIQKVRFGDRFHCQLDIAPECLTCMVPKLLLQPLLENSIKYGFRNTMDLHVRVEGRLEGGTLLFRVADDGGGMEEEQALELQAQLASHDRNSPSIGLRNLSRRLYLKYGSKSGVEVLNDEGRGFEVLVRIEDRREPACIKS